MTNAFDLDQLQLELDRSEPALQRHMERNNASCRPGCSHCCYQLTPVYWLEAQNMARAVKQLSPERQREISAACKDQTQLLERISVDAHTKWKKLYKPCPLLDGQGLCSAYHARPLACRGHAVVSDPARCDIKINATVEIVPGILHPLMEVGLELYRAGSDIEGPIPQLLNYALMERRAFERAGGTSLLKRVTRGWRRKNVNDDKLSRDIMVSAFNV